MRRLLATVLLVLMTWPALAQHNHAAGHNDYAGWSSGKVANCCNNDDCGELTANEFVENAGGQFVRIEDQWCPVKAEHRLRRGRSPDWSVPHACVGKSEFWKELPPCERLLCFEGKGGF